ILTGIKIDAKDNEVILTGSDSEISIEITIPKQVDGEDIVTISETGSVVLPGRFFVDIIKKLPGNEVKLSTNEQFQT
ncbi:DNA polymerase III subunit beta, partial [Staphylococcus saprophyticus]